MKNEIWIKNKIIKIKKMNFKKKVEIFIKK